MPCDPTLDNASSSPTVVFVLIRLRPRPDSLAWSSALSLRQRLCSTLTGSAIASSCLVSLYVAFGVLHSLYAHFSASHGLAAGLLLAAAFTVPAMLMVLLVITVVAVLTEIFANKEVVQARYCARRLRRLYHRLGECYSLDTAIENPVHVPAILADDLTYSHRRDEFPSPRLNSVLRRLESSLSPFASAISSAIKDKTSLAAAEKYLYPRFLTYQPPLRAARYLSEPPPPPPAYPDNPGQPVIFYVVGSHLVERPPPHMLSPEQLALRVMLLHLARPVAKDHRVRLYLAPSWVHALVSNGPSWYSEARLAELPSVSPAYHSPAPEAVLDLLAGIWSPPGSFERSFQASTKLAVLPLARRIPQIRPS